MRVVVATDCGGVSEVVGLSDFLVLHEYSNALAALADALNSA